MSKSRHLVDPELLPLLDAFPTVTIMDAFHGFDLMPGPAIADAARNSSREALRRALRPKDD